MLNIYKKLFEFKKGFIETEIFTLIENGDIKFRMHDSDISVNGNVIQVDVGTQITLKHVDGKLSVHSIYVKLDRENSVTPESEKSIELIVNNADFFFQAKFIGSFKKITPTTLEFLFTEQDSFGIDICQ